MATGKDRQRQLAREHYERQMRRRAERQARARRVTVIGSTVGVLVVVCGVIAAVTLLGGNDAETSAEAAPPTPAASSTPVDPTKVTCQYTDDSNGPSKDVGRPPAKPDLDAETMTLKTNHGDIVIDLEPMKAPCTVNSFAFLAEKDYFDGTKCHRLVTPSTGGLAILQCGDPQAKADGKGGTDGQGGPGYKFADENLGGMEYGRGVVAMANSGPDTNGSQFFIVYGDETKSLPPQYTPFGTVTKGMDIVDKVAEGGFLADNVAPKVGVEIKDVTISGKS
ncbi:peptidylprolyl isomerase [Thermostaphylospora chromogena]|uniref:Peptidyl-prolyl cis-trans isomerase n=1 Tax=Thermostaphylospora chromogena TaxID=35622 RepID=A0A1H1HND5_9ACTN|nr:peptidylprolyl isomerase [Thermostaphylospora chromogena]SDR26892.1 peptidyl-prolyl cis-trans isomerase B (cyclophilin B) [Thermostaphylospora chromogena]